MIDGSSLLFDFSVLGFGPTPSKPLGELTGIIRLAKYGVPTRPQNLGTGRYNACCLCQFLCLAYSAEEGNHIIKTVRHISSQMNGEMAKVDTIMIQSFYGCAECRMFECGHAVFRDYLNFWNAVDWVSIICVTADQSA